jgi:inositol oxygenase
MKRSHSYTSGLNYSLSVEPICIAIVGAGRAGEFHVESLSINKQFDLRYIIDINEDKASDLSKKAQCSFHNDLEWVLRETDIEAVIISTTTPTHYDLTMKCLNAGKHVFCEKPLGTEGEITNCFKLANRMNLKLLVAYQKRFDENYSKLYELIKDKRPQNIYLTTRDHPLPPLEYLETSNGIVEDMMSHDIDIANLYMNFELPERVVSFTYTHNEELQKMNEIEGIEVLMHYSEGRIVHLTGSRDAKHGYDQRVEVFGPFGLYKLDNQLDTTIQYYDMNGSTHSKMNYSFSQRYKDAYLKELDYFYKMIKENYSPLVDEQHLIMTKKICNAINQSIKTGNIIQLNTSDLRTYHVDTPQYYLYRDMHRNQTLDFVLKKKEKYATLNNQTMALEDALSSLDTFIDPSDPDLDEENSIHAYQTAERIRKLHPTNKELQLIGLIHDLGKVLFTFGEPTWAIVGDTYVVGCQYPESIVYYDTLKENSDFDTYDEMGIYEPGCGLGNLHITFGHDEYLYQVLKQNESKHTLSQDSLDIIRYHSFYPWHTSGEYMRFMDKSDYHKLKNVNDFNKFDLYSKEDSPEISEEIKHYYSELISEYFSGELQW